MPHRSPGRLAHRHVSRSHSQSALLSHSMFRDPETATQRRWKLDNTLINAFSASLRISFTSLKRLGGGNFGVSWAPPCSLEPARTPRRAIAIAVDFGESSSWTHSLTATAPMPGTRVLMRLPVFGLSNGINANPFQGGLHLQYPDVAFRRDTAYGAQLIQPLSIRPSSRPNSFRANIPNLVRETDLHDLAQRKAKQWHITRPLREAAPC